MSFAVSYFKKITKDQYFFILVFLIAVAIRVWDFGQMPYGMNQDGAMGAIDAKALADHGTDRLGMYMPVHFQAWGFGQMSVLLSYLSIPFIKLFGLNPVTARLPILILSILGLVVIYKLVKEICGVRGGQIALLITAFSPWHFVQSRWALDCNVFPHMMLFGVYFLILGVKYKKRYLYISMIFFALCMYSYGVAFYTLPVFLLLSCVYLLIRKRILIRNMLISMLVYFGLSWPIYLTMMINAFGWETIETPFFTMPFFPYSMRAGDLLFMVENPGEQLTANIKSFLNVFWEGDYLPWNTVPGYGTMFIWLVIICVAAIALVLVFLILNIRRRDYTEAGYTKEQADDQAMCMWLMFFWLICAVFGGVIVSNVNVNRINVVMYSQILFATFGVMYIYTKWKHAIHVLCISLAVGTFMLLTTYYSQEYKNDIEAIFMGGFGECLQELEDDGCEQYYIDLACNESLSRMCLELQTLFYLEVDAEIFQSGEFNDIYHITESENMPKRPPEGAALITRDDHVLDYDVYGLKEIRHGRYVAYYSE